MSWSQITRLSPFRWGHREHVAVATVAAAAAIFLGLALDVPTMKRVEALEIQRRALEGEVTGLKGTLDALVATRREVESAVAEIDSAPPTDLRFTTLVHYVTEVERRADVEFLSVRPAPSRNDATALRIEFNTPLRELGPYLERLARSPWALTIRELTLTRNSERVPTISTRFIVETPYKIQGLARTEAGK